MRCTVKKIDDQNKLKWHKNIYTFTKHFFIDKEVQKSIKMVKNKSFKKQRLVVGNKKNSVNETNFIETLLFSLFTKDCLVNDINLFKFFLWKKLLFLLNIIILFFNFIKSIVSFRDWKLFKITFNWHMLITSNAASKNEDKIFTRYIISSISKRQNKHKIIQFNNFFSKENTFFLLITNIATTLMILASIFYQVFIVIFLQIKVPILVAYIIHSQIPSTLSTACLHNEAEQCFKQLFEKNTNICTDHQLHFQCKHYNFLDECFTKKDVQCQPAVVGRAASTAYKKRRLQCQQQQLRSSNRRRHQYKSTIYRQNPPTDLQFISYIGYLQSICITNNTNCTSDVFRQDISRCEEDIKNKAPGSVKEANRHNLLRMKLQASSNLLQYSETKRDEECLLVRSSLTDIFQLHQSYCLQTSITRCMCERLNFEYFCNISCSRLEVKSVPFNQILTWSDFEGRLRSAVGFSQRTLKITTQKCFIIFIIYFIIKNF